MAGLQEPEDGPEEWPEDKVTCKMALPRSFKETVQARARRDQAFRDALLTEAVETLLSGEVDTGKAILRDYINVSAGFGRLADMIGTVSKSLMRTLRQKGNPTAKNLL